MAVSLDLRDLDPADSTVEPWLARLQGNILRGHGRRHTVLLPLRFRAVPRPQIEAWIGGPVARRVTSARQQLEDARRFRDTGQDGGSVFTNFFLSAWGYTALGRPPEELEPSPGGLSVTFRRGMKRSAKSLGDEPEQSSWDAAYRDSDVHAMLLLAADDWRHLGPAALSALAEVAPVAEPVAVESGGQLFGPDGQSVEHFGYADGISDPQFFHIEPGTVWQASAPLKLVLVPDPFAPADLDDCFGSFLVYRKLEQNVRRFHETAEALASRLAASGAELAGAMAVGRFPNGSPLILADTAAQPRGNDFDYRGDSGGRRCPRSAHIRKLNPRGESLGEGSHPAAIEDAERRHRIVRRGIPYGGRNGQENDPPAFLDRPETGVGLLFLCFQADISSQFAKLQRQWASEPDFPVAGAGTDPLVGSPEENGTQQKWPSGWDQDPSIAFDFRAVVTLKGGEFFFAPSLPFLESLASGV